MDVLDAINQIDWCAYETAYGNAGQTDSEWTNTPFNLQELFSKNRKQAKDATHRLWCGLCHQHAYISSAALPAYDILLYGLKTLDDELKVEILDILNGFAICTDQRCIDSAWQEQLRAKLKKDEAIFQQLISSPNEYISSFSESIYLELQA